MEMPLSPENLLPLHSEYASRPICPALVMNGVQALGSETAPLLSWVAPLHLGHVGQSDAALEADVWGRGRGTVFSIP